MTETFTREFGNEHVATMLVAAKTKDATKNIATKLEFAPLEMWQSSGKSVDDVFKLLKLPRMDHDFYHSQLLKTWVSYMDIISKENPGKTSALFSTLETRFRDRPLIQILEAAKKFPSMENVASKMQMEKIERIFKSGQSPEKIFKLIALDDVGDTVLGTPLFKKWFDYVEVFNKENPSKKESWFLPLRVFYHSSDLERMIDRGMQNPATMKIAKLVESARLQD